MKKITDIKPQVKNPTRCNIYLDNAFYCGLELETIMKNRLKIGTEIAEERLNEIQTESESLRALDKALNFISLSKKTKKEVEDYLKKKGYLGGTIETVTSKMSAYKFINDEEYAKDYVKSYSKKKGNRLLAAELKRKGVSDSEISEAIEERSDESEGANAVAEKYLRGKERTKENAVKCYRYLLGKGFSYDVAKEAAFKFIGGEEDYD